MAHRTQLLTGNETVGEQQPDNPGVEESDRAQSGTFDDGLPLPNPDLEAVDNMLAITTECVPTELLDEFSNAIPAEIWYENPPLDADQERAFNDTQIGALPREIRDKIWGYLTGSEPDIDITVRMPYRGWLYPPRFGFRSIIRLVGVCSQMREGVFYGFRKNVPFVHLSAKEFDKTIGCFHSRILQRFGILHLTNDRYPSDFHGTHFANMLSLICNSFPNLIHFQLKTITFDAGQLVEQETAQDLLRFGSFLIAKHPNLDILIWPGDSGPTGEPGQEEAMSYMKLPQASASVTNSCSKMQFPSISVQWMATTMRSACVGVSFQADFQTGATNLLHDHMLNSTILRPLKFEDMLAFSIDNFVIDRDHSISSEVDEGHDYFYPVDNEGLHDQGTPSEIGKAVYHC